MDALSNANIVLRANVLGVGVSAINLSQAVDLVLRAVQKKEKGYISVTGVHGVMEAQADESFRNILNKAFLNTPDGMPMSWVGRLQGFSQMDRVYGPDLLLAVADKTRSGEVRHFLYGGQPGVAEKLKSSLEARFPGIIISGTYTPPFRPLNAQEEDKLQQRMLESRPDICWVGLSTPKQERFMAAYLYRLPVTIMIGVGAAFDIHSGNLKQAPLWMQRSGFEWFFRLVHEPKRLWKRYVINNPLFIIRLFTQLTKIKEYSISERPGNKT